MMVSAPVPVDLSGAVHRVCAGRRSGRAALSEPEAQEITRLLGIRVPKSVIAGSPGEAAAAALPGERVVVKAIGPAHKTELGGMRIVANRPDDIEAAARAMAETVPADDLDGYLVAEFVDHDLDTEILAGVRWSEAFGPVVTIGPGGIAAEAAPEPAIVALATLDRAATSVVTAGGSRMLVEGLRGRPPAATAQDLVHVAAALLELGEAVMPHDLVAFEINPLVFTVDGPVALDALAIVGEARPHPSTPRPAHQIHRQLRPHTIAVAGVSENMNPGRVILRNILDAGFPARRVTVIKEGASRIEGCRCAPDVASLPEPVDLLVLAVPAEAATAMVEQALEHSRAHSILLIPGGLGETPGTQEPAQRIRSALERARRHGGASPAVTGPNSMGIRSAPGGYDATFIPSERMTRSEGRPVPAAVVAQSGAFTLARLDRLPWLDPRYVVTVGNQLDLTVGDYLEHFSRDPEVQIVACYVEGLGPGDGDRALRASARLRDRGGTLLWYRGGRTATGARAAASHTAAIATDDLVAHSLARGAGIVEARDLDEFEDLLRLAVHLHDRPIEGRRLAVVSNAGFECVAAADSLDGLRLAELSSITTARLQRLLDDAGLGAITSVHNPLDLTPIANDAAYAGAVRAVLADPEVDVAVVGCVPFTPALRTLPDQVGSPGSLSDLLGSLSGHSTPWVGVVDGGRLYDVLADDLEGRGVPVLRSMDRAVRLLGRYVTHRLPG